MTTYSDAELTVTCPSCGGSGRWNIKVVDHETREPTGDHHVWPCPVCGSRGKITQERADEIRQRATDQP